MSAASPHTLATRPTRANAPTGSVCKKQEPRDRLTGVFQPASDFETANRKGRFVCGRQALDAASRSRRIADDEQTGNATAIPSAVLRKLGCETGLAIERMKHLLAIGHDRLDLDNERHSASRMKRKNVDRTSLAPDGERNLDRYLPASLPERQHDQLDEVRMSFIEQPIELLAIPSKA